MCSSSLKAIVFATFLVIAGGVQARELRVCSDPNNLPFSNEAGEGFENKIVSLIAQELGAEVRYTWWAQRRGFLRNTLLAGTCDVVPGVAVGSPAGSVGGVLCSPPGGVVAPVESSRTSSLTGSPSRTRKST